MFGWAAGRTGIRGHRATPEQAGQLGYEDSRRRRRLTGGDFDQTCKE